ncbi:oligopeptide transport system ATP-binding protein [Devosia subaequoris]|uniref:Oligopeptide transport system ATP-binding protein n=1 Tax=Devosia subaequoris TaxID=395930 RepID=A0A7W6NCF8_9HYPH|nr:ATP-binding cassette domain-containing protein [Devosia subaequoris]MBB4052676.1 oligopeptide transport system ATP-binding protein [Devosia subaequoris]MCP1209831.1 ATP-binding cassette domain-containing protein [Devosia subaequoris]
MSEQDVILQVRNLSVHFNVPAGGLFGGHKVLKAVKNVSFDLHAGETLGIVGESGCGKSTLSRAIIRLIEASGGESVWMGKDILKMNSSELVGLRKDIQMIFQDPLASLNPRMTAGSIIAEPLQIHNPEVTKAERTKRVAEMMEKVGLTPNMINKYPHEFSGGQCQRIGIARALITRPKLIVCDEAVSALDVSVQAQVINLLMDLQKEFGVSLLFIAHDIAVVRHIAQRIMVLYFGEVVEIGESEQVVMAPSHDYTKKLIASVPVPDPKEEMKRREVRRRLRREAAAAA